MATSMQAQLRQEKAWPSLPLAEWSETRDTLHRMLQIVGKTRLALAPPVNHWWHITLYPTARGLTTSPMPFDGRVLEAEFDFVDHALLVRTGEGDTYEIELVARAISDFYREYTDLLKSLGVEARVRPIPSELEDELPFTEDQLHRSYDRDSVTRCWTIISQASQVLQKFRGRFLGKCSPVHFFWGAFDLACTRFSGRRAPLHPGGVPHLPDRVVREAYSHECISAGWWPGAPGSPVAEPAFYAYSYPEPAGFAERRVRPEAAYYSPDLKEFILPYEAVRTSSQPDQMLLDFLQATYDIGADLAGWERPLLERTRQEQT
jgi:Family of unknown function (DUF5996)